MKAYAKKDYPLSQIRRHLEPGPIVLVSSAWRGKSNIMTMGWHMMLEFTPALFACCISESDHSFDMVRKSRECVINVPTADLMDKVIAIGNTSGDKVDKFMAFGLTPFAAAKVDAPLIKECYANFECKLADGALIRKYNLFIWEVVKAHVAPVRSPKTLHYRGKGIFMVAGREMDLRRQLKARNL